MAGISNVRRFGLLTECVKWTLRLIFVLLKNSQTFARSVMLRSELSCNGNTRDARGVSRVFSAHLNPTSVRGRSARCWKNC